MSHARLALLLGLTVALAPLALDMYLPAFPAIARAFGLGHEAIGITLSTYVAVFGAVQLLAGPLSDRYGRRAVLQSGLGIFVLGSLLVAGADTLDQMVLARVVQALGGGACAVSVPAIVRDRTHGNEAARLIGAIGLVMFAAPALAPTIGSLVLHYAGWETIFLLLAGYGIALMAVLQRALFRHLPPRLHARAPVASLVTNYLAVFRCLPAMRFVAIQALVFSTLMVFLAHASLIYQGLFGVSSAAFSALFALHVAGMAGANLLNRRLLRHYPSPVLLRAAIAVQAGAVVLLALAALGSPGFATVAAAMFVVVACVGMIAPNNIANALELFPRIGGTAAAVLGATQFALAGVVSGLSTQWSQGALAPVAWTMAVCAVAALALAIRAPAAMARAVMAAAETR